MSYDINYDDQRFKEVESDKKAAISEMEKTYSGMINQSDGYYQAQIDASKQWEKEQTKNQQAQTDFAIQKIEQEKEQTKKDYLKEQSGAYADWQKQSNQYGANAEAMASQGMQNTGYSESSQVSMYNTYQNRVATARESYNRAVLDFNNSITEARLQNNSILAQIAYEANKQRLELSLQSFQYKNQLVLEQAKRKTELDQIYHDRWQDVLAQMNTENALAEEMRQFNEQMAEQQRQFNYKNKLGEFARTSSGGGGSSRRSYNPGKGKDDGSPSISGDKDGGSGSGSGSMSKETAQSILNLGGPYNAKTVANKIANGEVIKSKSASGNTVYLKNNTLNRVANTVSNFNSNSNNKKKSTSSGSTKKSGSSKPYAMGSNPISSYSSTKNKKYPYVRG
jgi:hypothetical protein